MQTILLQYQLEFILQEEEHSTMDPAKEEERLKNQLLQSGDLVDINMDNFPKRFIVTFSSKKETQMLLGQSMR